MKRYVDAVKIDVGLFGEDDKVLFLEKRRVDTASDVLEIVVDEPPKEAGVDPFNKLIDRNPEDNVKEVTSSN